MRFVIKTKKEVDGIFAFNYVEVIRCKNVYVNLEVEKPPSVGFATKFNNLKL